VKHLSDFKDVDFKDEQIFCKAVRQMDSGRDHKDKTVTWQKGGIEKHSSRSVNIMKVQGPACVDC
jgi:hypothetical protein